MMRPGSRRRGVRLTVDGLSETFDADWGYRMLFDSAAKRT